MPDINFNLSDALDAKIVAKWGDRATWKQWVKDETKRQILADELGQIDINARAAASAAREVALANHAAL